MTEIFVDPTKEKIAVKVTSQSMHVIGFTVKVYNAAQKNTESHEGNTNDSNPASVDLNHKPAEYKGGYISGTLTAGSPGGEDGPFNMELAITEDGIEISPHINFSGNTENGIATRIGTFHIN